VVASVRRPTFFFERRSGSRRNQAGRKSGLLWGHYLLRSVDKPAFDSGPAASRMASLTVEHFRRSYEWTNAQWMSPAHRKDEK
jgi:hypothetical protein